MVAVVCLLPSLVSPPRLRVYLAVLGVVYRIERRLVRIFATRVEILRLKTIDIQRPDEG